jgi:hypothetical protein
MPSSSPTFMPSSIPTFIPTLVPSTSPTASPSYSPTISMAPSNAFTMGIEFSVSQTLLSVDSDFYFTNLQESNEKFIQSLVTVVPDLTFEEIEILKINQTAVPLTAGAAATAPSIRRRSLATSDVLLVYQVTHVIPNGGTNADSIYNDLVNAISIASTGSSSSLATELRSVGLPFTTTTVPESPPDISTYSSYTEHTPLPSSTPTSAPSCGSGTEEGSTSSDCNECHPGTYSEFAGKECKECEIGSYCDTYGCISCEECPYPWTTTQTGKTSCEAIQLNLPLLFVYTALVMVIVFYFTVIYFLSKARLACLVIMTLPLFDVLTDFLYLSFSVFYGLESFIACALILTLIPNLVFFGIIIQQGATPRLVFGKRLFQSLLFLNRSSSGYPTAGGRGLTGATTRGEGGGEGAGAEDDNRESRVEIFKSFATHDSILKIFYFILCWFLAILGQLIALLPVALLLLLHLPIWLLWLFIGTFLYQSKIIAIGTIWNLWFDLWTGTPSGSGATSAAYTTTMALDTRVFNKSLLTEFLFESLPQLGIQSYNNTRLHKWTLLGYLSTAVSLFMTIDGIWRISYYKVYNGYSFRDIPVGMGIVKFVPDSQLKKFLDPNWNNGNNSNGNMGTGGSNGDEGTSGCIEAAERVVPSAPPLNDEGLLLSHHPLLLSSPLFCLVHLEIGRIKSIDDAVTSVIHEIAQRS